MDKNEIAPGELDIFAALEAEIVKAAARNITPAQKKELFALGDALMRCAKVGDVDTNIKTDRRIEEIMGQAAKLDAESKVLAERKIAFKEKWRSAHRLKETLAAAQMRFDQINHIINGNEEGAVAISYSFFEEMKKIKLP